MTYNEIKKLITDNDLVKFLFTEDFHDLADEQKLKYFEDLTYQENIQEYLNTIGFPKYKQISYVCNSDEMYTIIHFIEDDIYVKLIGTYDSYGNGEHYYHDGMKQVYPKEKMVTIYE